MSGVNAHAIIREVTGSGSLPAAPAVQATWASTRRCFVDVLVPLHPLLESATKVSLQEVLPMLQVLCQ